MNTEKVYCKKCKFYKSSHIYKLIFNDFKEQCKHPDNIITVDGYDKPRRVYNKSPHYINSYNHCKWYEPQVGVLRLIISRIMLRVKKGSAG